MPLPTTTAVGRVIKPRDDSKPVVTMRFAQGSGKPVASFTLVCDQKRKNEATGQWEDDKNIFLRVTAFGPLAEHLAESLTGSETVVVTGKVHVSTWETQDGQSRQTVELLADEVAASMRWDNVRVEKAERRQGGQAQQQADPWSGAPQQQANPWANPSQGQSDAPPF